MKTKLAAITRLTILAGVITTSAALAQPFDAGSTGADGALNVTSNTTLNLPANGIFNFTTINVPSGFTLKFNQNALNTPVYLLATSTVAINGTIDVSGQGGSATAGGRGGPGGFDGGFPGLDANTPPGAGYGPGGGRGGEGVFNTDSEAGGGGYATASLNTVSTNKGAAYGSALLVPLAGGSGGGGLVGSPGFGGGGGGGAIMIASNTKIDVTIPGKIVANGGGLCSGGGSGSGGAIRLVAPQVTGTGRLEARRICNGSAGRIRIDTTNRRGVIFIADPLASIGANMIIFPNPVPRLDVIEAAGMTIPEDTGAPVTVQLPFGSTTDRTVTVQARGFNALVPINVVLTPDSGNPVTYPTTIDNQTSNPAQSTINVTIPVNTVVTINAWTR